MKQNKFTIIIPTRNRADVLQWALKTCIDQDYDNLEIIVSDNFSEDNTKEVVASYSDPRLKYVNTDKRISMSHNWEFGLSKAQEGYVMILGDDDGFLPNSIKKINQILCDRPLQAISWYPSTYFWPNNPFHENELFILMREGITIRNGLNNFLDVINYKEHYSTNPWLYAGFVNVDLIRKIKKISGGTFFHSMIPDIYSGFAIASQVGEYIYSNGPFSIAGISSHSNGAAQFSSNQQLKTNFDTFLNEAPPIPFHSQLELIPSSFPVIVAECAMKTFDCGLMTDKKYFPDLKLVLSAALQQASVKNESLFEKELEGLNKIAEKNKISIDELIKDIRHAPAYMARLNSLKLSIRKKLQGKYIDGDKHKLRNVYDASLLHDKIYNSDSKAFFNFIKKTSDLLSGSKSDTINAKSVL